jgi:hypothetical protein
MTHPQRQPHRSNRKCSAIKAKKKGVRKDNGKLGPDGPDNADDDPLFSDLEPGEGATLERAAAANTPADR